MHYTMCCVVICSKKIRVMEKIECARCGKEIEKDKAIPHQIYVRKGVWEWKQKRNGMERVYKNRLVKEQWYFCSKECAINEQMALEG